MKAPGEYAKIMLPELTFPYLIPGQEVLLDDGKIHLKICGKSGKCDREWWRKHSGKALFRKGPLGRSPKEAERARLFRARRSIRRPLTNSDLANIKIAKEMGVTGVMQPFVRDHSDLERVKGGASGGGSGGYQALREDRKHGWRPETGETSSGGG